jgi:hypothetical protein
MRDAERAARDFHYRWLASLVQRDVPDDVPVAIGDPRAIRTGRSEKRTEVTGQEVRITVQSVNVANNVGAGIEVTVQPGTQQHPHIVAPVRRADVRPASEHGSVVRGAGRPARRRRPARVEWKYR